MKAVGYLSLMGCNKTDMRYWQMVEEFIIPWGKTFHLNLLIGAIWFLEGSEKAKCFLSLGCKGIVKKQSCKSIIIIDHPFGTMGGEGNPGYKGPIGIIILLTFLKSINIHHFLDFFLLQKRESSMGKMKALYDFSVVAHLLIVWELPTFL